MPKFTNKTMKTPSVHLLPKGLGEEVSVGTSAERGRLIPYHIVCTVSAEAPYSPLPVRGLLAVWHEALRLDLPKPKDQRGSKPKTSEPMGAKPYGEGYGRRCCRLTSRVGSMRSKSILGERHTTKGAWRRRKAFVRTGSACKRPHGLLRPDGPIRHRPGPICWPIKSPCMQMTLCTHVNVPFIRATM